MPLLYFLTRRQCGGNHFDSSQSGSGDVQGSHDGKAAVIGATSVANCRWSMPPNDRNVETGAGGQDEESPGHGRSIGKSEWQASVGNGEAGASGHFSMTPKISAFVPINPVAIMTRVALPDCFALPLLFGHLDRLLNDVTQPHIQHRRYPQQSFQVWNSHFPLNIADALLRQPRALRHCGHG